jgi:hypothetical protein
VDYNVEQMSVDVKGAVEELKTATTCVTSLFLPLSLLDEADFQRAKKQLPTSIRQMPTHLPPSPPHRRLPHHHRLQASKLGRSRFSPFLLTDTSFFRLDDDDGRNCDE